MLLFIFQHGLDELVLTDHAGVAVLMGFGPGVEGQVSFTIYEYEPGGGQEPALIPVNPLVQFARQLMHERAVR